MSASITETRVGATLPSGGGAHALEVEASPSASTPAVRLTGQQEPALQRERLQASQTAQSAPLHFATVKAAVLSAPRAACEKVIDWTQAFFTDSPEIQQREVEREQQGWLDNELATIEAQAEQTAEDERVIAQDDQRNRDRTVAQKVLDAKAKGKAELEKRLQDRTRR